MKCKDKECPAVSLAANAYNSSFQRIYAKLKKAS